MHRLTQASLRNRSVVALLTLLVAAGGLLSAFSLKQELFPDFSAPQMSVVTTSPGASPEVVDERIAVPLSAALEQVEGVTSVVATSSTSVSSIALTTDYGLDQDQLTADVEAAIEGVRQQLPDDVEPEVTTGSLDDVPVMSLTASSEESTEALSGKLAGVVVPELTSVEGVRDASVSGGVSRRVTVDLDQAALTRAGLSATDVSQALQVNGASVPAGTISGDGSRLSVTAGTALTSVEQIAALPLVPAATGAAGASAGASDGAASGSPSSGVVTLGQVAKVSLADEPATSITRIDGRQALSVSVLAEADADVVSISDGVNALIPSLEEKLGSSAVLTVANDQAPFISKSIEHLAIEGGLGLLFAVLVILVFLLSIRSTLVTAISIPMSVLVTFIGLYLWGYSLNILTLGALTIAIGRVVDDSIVVIENIKRHLASGEEKMAAVLGGVKEVAGAITASTITTVLVFLPIAVVGGLVGELFRPFSLTVTIAMLSSLFVALTLVPVLAYWFLRAPKTVPAQHAAGADTGAETQPNALQRAYSPLLRATLRRPLVVLVVAVAMLGGSLALLPRLGVEFIGNTGENSLSATQTFDSSLDLAQVTQSLQRTEQAMEATPGVETVLVTASLAGSGPAQAGPPTTATGDTTATFTITTDENQETSTIQDALEDRIDTLPDAGDITVGQGGGFGSSTVDVAITSDDEANLNQAADQVGAALADVPETTAIENDRTADQPSVEVTVDRVAAARLGLTEQAVSGAVAQAITPTAAGSVTLDGARTAVYVGSGTNVTDIARLRALTLPTATGTPVALTDVAEVKEVTVPSSVRREDGSLVATISLTPENGELGTVESEAQSRIDALDLPDGVQVEIGGVAEQQNEAFAQLGIAMLVAIGLIFVLLVGIFRSFAQAMILLISIPFAAIGALVLLFVTGTPLGVAALIGMLMLIGIVVTNAIVLMDLINQYRDQGQSVADAVEHGAGRRVRPIVMTALATIFALLPMALGVTGGNGFISQALAVVVIGGLFSSTALTLLLVPALYELVERRKERRAARRVPQQAEPERVPEPV